MTTNIKILIAGSRTLKETPDNLQRLEQALDEMHCILATANDQHDYPTTILHGGAKGADQLAGQLAQKLNLQVKVTRPNYDMWGAGWAPLKRNLEMIEEATAVIVFYAKGKVKKGGSGFVADRTAKANKHLLEIIPDGFNIHTEPKQQLF